MLGAGVVAAGDVEVDGLVEDGEVCVEVVGEGDGVGFGVGGREAAAAVAGAGDGSAENGACGDVEVSFGEGLFCSFEVLRGDVGDEQVLPDGEAELARAEAVGDVGEGAHLGDRQAADRDGDADVVQAGLRLGMDADVPGAVDVAAWFALGCIDADEGEGEELFGLGDESFDAPTVGAVTVLGEDADHGCGDGDGLLGEQEESAVGGELAMAGDPGEQDAEVDSVRDAAAFFDLDGHEADVIRVGDDGDGSSVVEGDVELAGEVIHVGRV